MKTNFYSKTHKYSQIGEFSKKTNTVWIVLHGWNAK